MKASLLYQDGLILLEKTQLTIGNSNYNIVGNLNINSGEVQGKIDINQGKIQDLLTALQLYNWDSLLRLLQLKQPNFTTAEKVKPNPVGNTLNSIAEQLYLFWKNDQKIKEIFAKTQAGDLPRELDIKGQYNAEIILDGTIENPQLAMQFQGNEWTWNPQPSTASIVPSLGLVMEGSQVIPIDKIAINGQLKDGTISVNPMIQLGTTTALGILNLSYNSGQYSLDSSAFKVENFTLDLVRNLIIIPSDVNGSINIEGIVNGTLKNPVVDGIFEFNEGVINARSLDIDLEGQFNYSNDKLQVATNQPEYINVSATLPFPIVENKNDQFKITANLTRESFTLLSPLTLDQIIWVGGDGNVTANIQGKISIDNQLRISLDSDSQINLNLDDAKFTNNLIPTVITLNGGANINNRSINVENLAVDVVKSRLGITGSLPLLPLENQPTINNTLTIQIRQNEINDSGIYQGLINGDVFITGALINPKISGNLNLTEGTIKLPKLNIKPEETSVLLEKWLGTLASENNIVIPPQLNDFQINLDNIAIENERTSLIPRSFLNIGANLNLSGNLTLNGQINRLSLIEILTVEPSGQIKINSGQINFPVTRVFISDQNQNTLTFLPEQGLLNPVIDLELKLYIFAVALRSIQDNEIPDDIVQSGRAKSAEITLNVQGSADEVLPNINNIIGDVCQFNDPNSPPITNYNKTSPENLRALARCIEVNNLGTNSIGDLLRSPIVSFSSNPPLTNTELSTLFSQQLPPAVEQLQQQNSSQLLQTGVVQSAVVILPFLQDWVFNTNQQTTKFGESIGLTNLRLFPVVETVYKLEDNALIRFSYDYTLDEATIRYENKF
ncbi:translocation/assembly module TamB domain-containing protein [Cyanothece sp. BG0011]|uniref:translocation/assembly module TamB domain-containing protein n=1 Tax=Cyanothece sp. BG0011 TaxID=2082950 RepID=UPI0018E53DEF|nr:translocation/assembly module TamB domain-containing protein [Cyanothece sp. BG0011]